MNSLRFTLFQCRERDDPMRKQEIDCFLSALQIDAAQLKAVNLPETPLERDLFDFTDVFLVGGSGDYSVLDSHSFLRHFFSFLKKICQRSQPMFASCFGFQALCVALGGSVIYSPENAEVGTYEVHLNEQGQKDPIFSPLPNSFYAQMGHKDRATVLPEVAVNLAFSEKAPFQAFRIKDQPIYATQFHPEMTMRQNRERFETYIQGYSDGRLGMAPQSIRQSFRASVETYSLLPRFIKLIVATDTR